MEFADGNYGLLEGALEYSQDVTPPVDDDRVSAALTGGRRRSTSGSPGPARPAVIHYTTDGSTPTLGARRTYENQGPRRPGEVLTLDRLGVHDVKWIAVDIKGNVSAVQTQRFLIAADEETGDVGGTVPATLTLTLGAPASVRRVHAGHRRGLHGVDDGQRDHDGRRRDAVGRRPELDQHGPARQRHVLAGPAAAGLGVEHGGTGAAFAPVGGSASPTSLLTYSRPDQQRPGHAGLQADRSAPTRRCAPAPTARR